MPVQNTVNIQASAMAASAALYEEDPRYPQIDTLASTRTLRLFFDAWAGKKGKVLFFARCLELDGIVRQDVKVAIDEWTVSFTCGAFPFLIAPYLFDTITPALPSHFFFKTCAHHAEGQPGEGVANVPAGSSRRRKSEKGKICCV
jgi:hypothetical protein